jgi:hypothetical protein
MAWTSIGFEARAETLKGRLALQSLNTMMMREAAYTGERCEAPIAAQISVPAARAPALRKERTVARCDAALSALETFCAQGDAARAAVAARIEALDCRPGAPLGVSLQDKVLVFVPGDGGDSFRFVLQFLNEALPLSGEAAP